MQQSGLVIWYMHAQTLQCVNYIAMATAQNSAFVLGRDVGEKVGGVWKGTFFSFEKARSDRFHES